MNQNIASNSLAKREPRQTVKIAHSGTVLKIQPGTSQLFDSFSSFSCSTWWHIQILSPSLQLSSTRCSMFRCWLHNRGISDFTVAQHIFSQICSNNLVSLNYSSNRIPIECQVYKNISSQTIVCVKLTFPTETWTSSCSPPPPLSPPPPSSTHPSPCPTPRFLLEKKGFLNIVWYKYCDHWYKYCEVWYKYCRQARLLFVKWWK